MRKFILICRIGLVKRSIPLAVLLSTMVLLTVPAHGHAQIEIAPTQATAQGDGEVSGIIINQSPGGKISEALDIMLHAWDANRTEKLMLHGKSNPDGTFVFADLNLEPGLAYSVMTDYQGTTYYSDPIPVQAEEDLLDIQVPVYDLTQDLAAVRIEEMHVLLNWVQGDLGITEVYIFSNAGEFTVKGGHSLEDGTPVTLMLPLPEDAWDVNFSRDNGKRFRLYPGGFADTAPLLPGQPSGQIIVSYLLPYEDGMTYAYSAPFDVTSLDFFYPQEAGMQVMNDLLESKGEWDNPNGGKFLIYSHPPLKSGEGMELRVFGEPPQVPESAAQMESGEVSEASTAYTSNLTLWIGILGGFGLILIGAGVWLWRRSVAEEELEVESGDPDLDDLLAEVAELEEAFEHKQIEQEQYFHDRTTLHQRIRTEIDQWETQHSLSSDTSEELNPMIDAQQGE